MKKQNGLVWIALLLMPLCACGQKNDQNKEQAQDSVNGNGPALTEIALSGFHPREYGVSVKYFKGEEAVPYKRMDYEAIVTVDPQGEVCIGKNNFFYDRHTAHAVSEVLADVLAKSIYPVKTDISRQGTGGLEVLNQEQILQRFAANKSKLAEKYGGEPLERLLEKHEHRLKNTGYLRDVLRNDWFCNLLFHPKMLGYREGESVDTLLWLSAVPYQGPRFFRGRQTFAKASTYYGAHAVTFEGYEQKAPRHFIPKDRKNGTDYYIKLDAEFDIDIYHNFPMHTRATLTVLARDADNATEVVQRIIYTQYQQNTEQNRPVPGNDEASLLPEDGEEETARKKLKKSCWNIFQVCANSAEHNTQQYGASPIDKSGQVLELSAQNFKNADGELLSHVVPLLDMREWNKEDPFLFLNAY